MQAPARELGENRRMQATLDALRAFQSSLLLAIHGIAEEDLRRPEAEGKWAVADVIAHLADLELVYAVRIRTILSGSGNAPLPALAQEAWVERVHRREPVAELLEQFWFDRRRNLALVERLGEEELARSGDHPQYGTMTIPMAMERIFRHDARHLAQIERIKTALGLTASDQPDVRGVVAGAPHDDRSPGPGVRVRTLWSEGVKRALEVEFAAGAQWPGLDYHVPGPEEVYILEGDFDDGANVYRAGTFLHHPAGSSHSPKSVEGCRLFVFYPEG